MNIGQMPWGKYRGEWIEDLPQNYLEWIYKSVSFLSLPIGTQRAIIAELKKRENKVVNNQ